MDDATLLRELAPEAERLLNRHLGTAKEWFPHEYVPWSLGRDFVPGEVWEETDGSLPQAVRSALFMNLLTEDNLPYYSAQIDKMFGQDHPWREWTRRWTAEEMRHAIVMRDWVIVTRSLDPVELERARMHQVATGVAPEPPTAAEGMVYVALQELATRIAHRNTGKHLTDAPGEKIMARVAADENLHYLFYRDIVTAGIGVSASTMMKAIAAQVIGFHMPGTGIRNFTAHARVIANAGIYDIGIFLEQVLIPVVRNFWRIEHLEGLDAEAEEARDRVTRHFDRLRRVVARYSERRAEEAAEKAPALTS